MEKWPDLWCITLLNSADLQDIIIGTICSKLILAGSKETIKQ